VVFAFSYGVKIFSPSPANKLGLCTTLFSSLTPTMSMLFQTEVGAFQGGGLSLLPVCARKCGVGTDLLPKALFYLCLLVFLV